MKTLPLLPETQTDPVIAYRGAVAVTRSEFLRHVSSLAERLPETGHVTNLCKDRYRFAVAFFAAILRGIKNVLPNSTAPENLAALCAEMPDLVCLGDQAAPPYPMPYMRVDDDALGASGRELVMPRIPFDQPIACVYTSGSTGRPRQHIKTFGKMVACAQAEAERLWQAAGGPCAVLGTVPFQHMYGLESTVLLPILGGGQLTSRLPFYPADVAETLAELPAPRLLVSTPFHLRKLLDAGIDFPQVAAVLSATAPLSAELAREVETRFNAKMLEIYGSTETGQLATRRPAVESEWLSYAGITLSQDQDVTTATGGHLESDQVLNDIIELLSPCRFRLIGRNTDMVNIVGKRSSLSYLNHLIAGLPGVKDGVFCLPESGNRVSRMAAFVVAPELGAEEVISYLQQHLDPVFLPRPIVFLDALPRDGNGKITTAAMADLVARHLSPES